MNNKHLKKGFTLIELLVVVLIIGILAAVAMPQYQKAVEKSRATEAITTISNIQKVIDVYALEHGGYTNERMVACQDSEDGRCGLLDIDVESSFICDLDGGNYCRSKYFVWQVYCYGDGCFMVAMRHKNPADFSEGSASEYMFEADVDNGVWDKRCYYHDNPPYGKSICDGAVAQGFSSAKL